MAAFDAALSHVLKHEGGYVNDDRDPGGETRFGISKRSYPNEDIRNLTVQRAGEIYFRDFWTPIRGNDLPPSIALAVFDTGVSMGTRTAVKLLQRAAGVKDDGQLGPITIAAVRIDPQGVLTDFLARRMKRYAELSTFPVFGLGWTRRTLDTHRAALLLA